jgi:hypothetical protein
VFRGGLGDDSISGGGNDDLYGGVGSDMLDGGSGDGRSIFESGEPELFASLAASQLTDSIVGGDGTDTLRLLVNTGSPFTISAADTEATGINTIDASSLLDANIGLTLIGSAGTDSITGGAGAE